MSIIINEYDALIVVDIQNDFCPNGALAVENGDTIIPLINALMPNFSQVILTQDWHTADHVSFFDNHDDKQPFDRIELSYGEQILWPRHCVGGTQGADFHPELDTTYAKTIVRKGYRSHIDSYSAFLEADRMTPTGLSGYLRVNDIKRVFIAGLATDFCVAWTAVDAVHFGFETYVIEDACRAIDTAGSLALAWQNCEQWGVKRMHSQEILDVVGDNLGYLA